MEVMIVHATVSDLDRLVDLEYSLFTSDRISRRQFRHLICRGHCIVLCLYLTPQKALGNGKDGGGLLQGYSVVLFRRNSSRARIYSIGIAPELQGKGYGGQLLAVVERLAKEKGATLLTLEVDERNCRAIDIYSRSGFFEYKKKAQYYEDGGTAILMGKQL